MWLSHVSCEYVGLANQRTCIVLCTDNRPLPPRHRGVNDATPFLIHTGAGPAFVTPHVEHIRAQLIAGGAQLIEAQTNGRDAKYADCPLSRH